MMWSKEHLLKVRRNIYLASASLSDEDALETPELFPGWEVDTDYTAGDRVRFGGVLYRCEQSHRSQESWEPDIAPALWTQVAEPGEIPVWRQPSGAQDAYMAGDLVHYPDKDGPVYESTVDYNTWSPDVYGWVLRQ